jgi:hypothetical protein
MRAVPTCSGNVIDLLEPNRLSSEEATARQMALDSRDLRFSCRDLRLESHCRLGRRPQSSTAQGQGGEGLNAECVRGNASSRDSRAASL